MAWNLEHGTTLPTARLQLLLHANQKVAINYHCCAWGRKKDEQHRNFSTTGTAVYEEVKSLLRKNYLYAVLSRRPTAISGGVVVRCALLGIAQ